MFLIISRSFLLRTRNISDENSRENQNTHFVFNNFFSRKYFICEMWENMVDPDRPQKTICYCECVLHDGYLRLQTHTQNIQYLLLFHGNSGSSNAPPYYVKHLGYANYRSTLIPSLGLD